jgi:hypothetical protein
VATQAIPLKVTLDLQLLRDTVSMLLVMTVAPFILEQLIKIQLQKHLSIRNQLTQAIETTSELPKTDKLIGYHLLQVPTITLRPTKLAMVVTSI